MNLKDWADVASIISAIGVVGAIGALFFGWKQLTLSVQNTKHSAANSEAQLWLDLRKMFDGHMEVHTVLRPPAGGEAWAAPPQPCPACREDNQKKLWPCCKGEWAKVESYMGLFEHCEGLLAKKLIDRNVFKDIYLYRIKNIVTNREIYQQKLVGAAPGWKRFLALMRRFHIEAPA